MLLVMDVGNTNIKIGLFDEETLVDSWRIAVATIRTADEYAITLKDLFETRGITLSAVDGVIISSVVPSLNYTLEHMCDYYFHIHPIMVGADSINTGGLFFRYENLSELGADRIVNAVAAYNLYSAPLIVVDLGTATTFGAVSGKGVFLGGAIAPGLRSSVDYLGGNAAKLRRIELVRPKHVININTVSNMQSGAVYGFTGLLKYMIERMKKEMKEDSVKVIATGGLVELIDTGDKLFDKVDRTLTLRGLRILYLLNKDKQTKTE